MKKIDLKGILNLKKEYLIVSVVVGVVLMMLGRIGSVEEVSSTDNSNNKESSFDLDFSYGADNSEYDYITYATERIKQCLEKTEGVGAVEVFLTLESESKSYMSEDIPTVQGIMVVAEGADNPVVVQEITEACEALFSLSVHKIKVVRMRGD